MSELAKRITKVLQAHLAVPHGAHYFRCAYPCEWKYGTQSDHAEHVAEQIEAAMREDGIVGFVRANGTLKPRAYTDADAQAWVDPCADGWEAGEPAP